MTDEITNKVLLKHMQGMKFDLQQQISKLEVKIDYVDKKVDQGFKDVDQRLKEATEHRQALQEDLEASIAMLGRHQEKLERISV